MTTIQRLNLHALLGAQRGDVATFRDLWALQDKLALSPEEEGAIELKRDLVGGQERVVWNPLRSLLAKEFEFSDGETACVRVALETWSAYGVAADRRWLEPLLRMAEMAELPLANVHTASGRTGLPVPLPRRRSWGHVKVG